jgi:hypothetical protein
MHVMLLNQKSPFDPPAITGTEVTTGMDVEPTDGAAGEPSLFALFSDDLRGLGIDRFPLLGTDDDVEVDMVFAIGAKIVTDRIDPLELLSSLAPVLTVLVFFLGLSESRK